MIFRYPGSKSKKSVQKKILKYFPNKYKEFRDSMVGGGGIFFAIPPDKIRWINDINPHLMQVYTALQHRSEEFMTACREIEPQKEGEELTSSRPGGRKIYNARLKGYFDFFKNNEECDQALRYFFINRTVFAGRVNYEIESRLYYSNPQGWNIVKTDKLERAAEFLKNVKITTGDYTQCLFEGGEDVVVYCDPPYFKNTELSLRSKLYKDNFSKEDHILLAEHIKKCPHKVVISYDDHEFIRSLYSEKDGFRVYSENWTYCGTSLEKKEVGNELIIVNFSE